MTAIRCARGFLSGKRRRSALGLRVAGIALAVAGSALVLPAARAQSPTPEQVNALRDLIGNHVEAATILGGDFGLGGASYSRGRQGNIEVGKFGGSGTIGAPRPLETLPFAWQPLVQGEIGYLTATTNFDQGGPFVADGLQGTNSKYRNFSIQFGGGARLWFGEHFSVAPTISGMFGHTTNEFNPNDNAAAAALLPAATALGLVDYFADTWTLRPSADFQYVTTFGSTIVTLNSIPTYFRTQSFSTSNPHVKVSGNSETWKNQVDVDIPLGMQLFGHELRTGGFVNRNQLYGGVRDGLQLDHLSEVHARLVLDFLRRSRYAKWVGIGASYLWGSNQFSGVSFGADVAFQF